VELSPGLQWICSKGALAAVAKEIYMAVRIARGFICRSTAVCFRPEILVSLNFHSTSTIITSASIAESFIPIPDVRLILLLDIDNSRSVMEKDRGVSAFVTTVRKCTGYGGSYVLAEIVQSLCSEFTGK